MSLKSSRAKHILELTVEEKQNFLESFDTVLSDCDGVLWLLVGGIPNSGKAVNLLRNAGKNYKFISNNSMRTDDQYLQNFKDIGLENVEKDDLVNPVKVIVKYINENFPQQPCFVMGSKTFSATLRENGVNVKTFITPPDIEIEDLPKLITPTDSVAAVIFDIDVNMTFAQIGLAQQYLHRKDCQLLVGAFDNTMPLTKNFNLIGPASIINTLANICDKEIQLFGKPGHNLGQHILHHFQIKQPKRVLFIGDNLDMDMEFGLKLGFRTLFVLSGAHSVEDMLAKPLELQPNFYADSMADFIEFFNDLKN